MTKNGQREEQTLFSDGAIEVGGARVHNLKNISVSLPRHKLSVVTGLSGSGKSSLVFDVLLAEGQRRYIETFSAYARGFLSSNERPDVDYIDGLSPVVAIEQKTASHNTRSTVGTVTEIYDFLRLLYARLATPYSYVTGKVMKRYNQSQLCELILTEYEGKAVELLAPMVRDRKGHYKELFETLRLKGYLNVYIDGVVEPLRKGMMVSRYKRHYIAVIVDKLVVKKEHAKRIDDAISLILVQGEGMLDVRERETGKLRHLSSRLMDPDSGIAYLEPSPATFSFNTERGWCPLCKGLGKVEKVNYDKVISDPTKPFTQGAISILSKFKKTELTKRINEYLKEKDIDKATPFQEIPQEVVDALFYGDSSLSFLDELYSGITPYIENYIEECCEENDDKSQYTDLIHTVVCPECSGYRLKKEALSYKIGEYNIGQLSELEISKLVALLPKLRESLPKTKYAVADEILKEIHTRLDFLLDVGLDYLTLGRATTSLSGGESQRIRLATQIGTGLVEVLYLLDEPGIGLHARDTERLLKSLKKLRDAGNTIVVVEHDKETMLSADYIVDLGPGAGRTGGEVVFAGSPRAISSAHSLTADYLNGIRNIEIPSQRRKGSGKYIVLKGATGNNLKNVTLKLPLETFICITGVSGSGKSSIINETLVPQIAKMLYHSTKAPLPFTDIEGVSYIDKLSVVDQSPIGRTPRSNPATYTGVFTEIRNIFVSLPESKARGYKPGRFSFNVSGGRCEACKGNGYRTISMRFLPDVTVPCEVCRGKRYSRETLEVRFKGKSISDVLDMTINQASEFFANVPKIKRKLETMRKVGLGYVKLGQPSTTLSGGEAQRVKLSQELAKRDTGKTLYILDEPTTGLHFEDIRLLLAIVDQLVEKGNTVIIIEHDLDVIKSADYLIDMGPEGGERGGEIIFEGTPEEMAEKCKRGATAPFVQKALNSHL